MAQALWLEYLNRALKTLEKEHDDKVILASLLDLKSKVYMSMSEPLQMELLNRKFKEFEQGYKKTMGYSTKQVKGFVTALCSEIFVLTQKMKLTTYVAVPTTPCGPAPTNNSTATPSTYKKYLPKDPEPKRSEPQVHFLNDILQTTLAHLSDNAMDSTWTLAIMEMVDHMLNFITDEELAVSQSTVEKILIVLKEHGWTGVDFYSAPNKQSLRTALSAFVNVV